MECSIGLFVQEDCHKFMYSRSSELISKDELNENDKFLLNKRLQIISIVNICTYHYKKYITYYFHAFGKKCCDPLKVHKKTIRKSLKEITVNFCDVNKNVDLIPGQAICSRCIEEFKKNKSEVNSNDINEVLTQNFDGFDVSFEPNHVALESLNKVCSILDELPIPPIQKLSALNRKRKIDEKVNQISNKIRNKLEATFEVKERIQNKKTFSDENSDLEYLNLIEELKIKFKTCNTFAEKYEILSLLPKKWTISKIQSEFDCSEYLVRNAKKLREENGVLPKIMCKESAKRMSTETITMVTNFYEDDEISRIMPGQRDCVTVRNKNGEKSKEQKRLVLFNLKEIYVKFKETYPLLTVGFSTFASLRPKNCILAGAAGTHTVCVCCIHQNMKLMLMACNIKFTYKDLLKKIVCDDLNAECMFSCCNKCPGTDAISSSLWDESEILSEIRYKQWISTDRCNLVTLVKTTDEFINELKQNLIALKSHHFIAKKQSEYLKTLKETLKNNIECIALVDFSENYTFVVQDEVQSFHWTNDQATLHPFVIYYKENGSIKTETLCVISDCLNHNTISFYSFQKTFIDYIKNKYPQFKKIHYFSDGSAAQYKNKKNFINICHHKDDFGLEAEWHFFATSHGKSPCDGAGGTIKRTVRKASLQRTADHHILTPTAMFDFCSTQIPGIKFFFVSISDVDAIENFLSKRFTDVCTIKNTRNYHSFSPISRSQLKVRKFSASDNFETPNIIRTSTLLI